MLSSSSGITDPKVFDETRPRNAPFEVEPGYYVPGRLWLYGNVKLLHGQLSTIPGIFGPSHHSPKELDVIERLAEAIVLDGDILVCGVHNAAHQRAALIPLRWGSPRILVFSGGFHYHLGKELDQEPFRAAQLWRFQWDAKADLAISRRAPDKKPTYAAHNPTVDRLIAKLVQGTLPGFSSPFDSLTPVLHLSD